MDSGISKINKWFDKKKFTFLLFSLILYTIAAPFFEGFLQRGIFFNIFFPVFLVTAVYAVSSMKDHLIFISVITGISILLFLFKFFIHSENILIVDAIVRIMFNGYLVYIITGYSYQCDHISKDTISAALIGYILLGLLWSHLYFLIELIYPNSFTISHETIVSNPEILRYFSFVTITTLGYGDISPVTDQARNITISEAFVGQMYMAVLIARLVAIRTSRALEK